MTIAPDNIPGFICIDHVGIAVRPGDLEAQVAAYSLLGFREIHREEVQGTDQVREVLLQIGDGPNRMQLLEPMTSASPVQKLIDRNNGQGGFAHLAYRVRDIHAAFRHLRGQGFRIVDSAPRPGSRGATVFFIHPKSREDAAFGFLIEIVEEKTDERA